MLFKKSVLIRQDQREFLCVKIYKYSTVNQNALNFEGFLMHYKGRPSYYLFLLVHTL